MHIFVGRLPVSDVVKVGFDEQWIVLRLIVFSAKITHIMIIVRKTTNSRRQVVGKSPVPHITTATLNHKLRREYTLIDSFTAVLFHHVSVGGVRAHRSGSRPRLTIVDRTRALSVLFDSLHSGLRTNFSTAHNPYLIPF